MVQLSSLQYVPKDSRTWRLWLSIFVVGAAGAARGLDEGVISNEVRFKSFQNQMGIDEDDATASNIISMMTICAIAGSLVAFAIVDTVGRVRCTQIAVLTWMIGSAVWISSKTSGQVLAGRAIAGLGIGFTPVSSPVYLSEITPSPIRGLAVLWYAGSVYIGIVLGYFCNYGVNQNIKVSNAQWQIPICLNFIVGSIIFSGSFFIKESPRWLIKVGKHERARDSLAWLRHLPLDHPELRAELDDIDAQVREEKHLTDGLGLWGAVKEMFGHANNRYKLAMCVIIQILGQFSGGGSFTVFAPKFLALVGKTGNTGLLTTGLFGIVKMIASLMCALFVIDLLGRRRCVSIGIMLQAIAALYLAIYLKVAYVGHDTSDPTPSQKRAATGGVVMIFVSGIGWAFGVNSIQSTNPMIEDFNTWGAFLFYAGVCVLLLLFIFFFLPETAGYSLEQIDALFDLPWYKIGLASRRPFECKTPNGRMSLEDGPAAHRSDAEKPQFGTYGGAAPTVASPDEDDKKAPGMSEAEQKRAAGMTTTATVDY